MTNLCNSKCVTCFYWDHLNVNRHLEMSLEDYDRALADLPSLFSVVLTGGEPTLNHDLPEITRLLYRRHDASNVTMPTNSLIPEQVEAIVARVLESRKDARQSFTVGLSLDHLGKRHDEIRGAPAAKPWKPWFPVIDYSRCTNCMQCLSFCLFDVYGAPGGKIGVQNPANCKTDCPACSRVCPEVAILFPKYKAGPINGDEVNTADLEREKMKIDISALLGGDIYAALRQRSQHAQSRFARERDDQRALEERKRCLTKLQQALDIPQEVMNALPGADAIREKAERDAAQAGVPASSPGPLAPATGGQA
jgi:NAD-dependent dihydropyrimidine dehydrogenase PreA subunit